MARLHKQHKSGEMSKNLEKERLTKNQKEIRLKCLVEI
jgi:hypothetical protein